MSGGADDPLIRELRERISAADRTILDALNERLRLVERIKHAKRERGLDFVDPGREQALLGELAAANGGPLSPDGVRETFTAVLALTKRELERAQATES